VYVAAAKRSILSCLDLPAELSALLTTNHLDANIHAVRAQGQHDQLTQQRRHAQHVRTQHRVLCCDGWGSSTRGVCALSVYQLKVLATSKACMHSHVLLMVSGKRWTPPAGMHLPPACTYAVTLLLLQVPMRQVTLEAMESLLLRYKGRYTTVVGFKPTGWSHAGGAGRGAVGHAGAAAAGPSRSSLSIKPNRRRSQRGTVVMYQVCSGGVTHMHTPDGPAHPDSQGCDRYRPLPS
jgi:hypothetical protein